MTYEQDIHHVHTGDRPKQEDLALLYSQLRQGIEKAQNWKDSGELPLLSLPERTDDLDEIEKTATYFRNNFAHVLVVGTGGSSLGGQTLAAMKDNPYLPARKGAPKLYFLDNVDPYTMDMLLDSIDLGEAGCLVISKSGGTAEIMAQTLVLLEKFEARIGKDAISKHFLSITEPKESPLTRLSARYNIRMLDHDPKVGGRFSVLSLVGLIPAAIAGLDVRAIRKGAGQVLQAALSAKHDPKQSPPAVGAALHYALMLQGYDITVLMPYCDRLAYFGMWFRQLWAESLGKDGQGSTPIRAMGTVDQHSQLQLYLDGPKDKFFTLILPDYAGQGPRIDGRQVEEEKLAYIRDKTIGDVMAAYQHGTTHTLANNSCPVRLMRIKQPDETTVGALLMHFMLETIFTAHLMQVNAFDQPAVEESKVLAREYLSTQKAA